MPPVSVLIKPTSDICNIDCKYCFYHDVAKHREVDERMMSIETLEQTIIRIFEFADQVADIAFQGGEPTLRGLDFFKTFITLVEKHNTKQIDVRFSIQTNGIKIDEEWAMFLKKHQFLVGISLDGPKEVHDKYRVDQMMKPTFDQVMKAIGFLKKHRVDFNILQVVTKTSSLHAEEIYQFFKANQLQFIQPIPVLDDLYKGFNNNEYSLSSDDYTLYLKKTFDLWYQDFINSRGITITYFEHLITKIMGGRNISCGLNGVCTIQFVIEADGSLYPCDFYVTDEWKLGTVKDTTFLSILKSKQAHNFVNEYMYLNNDCYQCKWKKLCNGGCKRYRQSRDGVLTTNQFCKTYQEFFEYAFPRMSNIAKMYQ